MTLPEEVTTTPPSSEQQHHCHYDVVVVGAGPAALATLSALQESFSLDHLTDPQRNQVLSLSSSSSPSSRTTTKSKSMSKKRVCVVDPSGKWMTNWKENFATLEIQFLRSPALAHPDAFDEHALLAYAVTHNRYQDELLASGCSDVTRLQGLGEAYNGLWHMPSSRLFQDFCDHLAQTLPHEFVQDSVVDIQNVTAGSDKAAAYRLSFANKSPSITAKSIVLATGAVGVPTFPKSLLHVPKDRLLHWKRDLNPSHAGAAKGMIPDTWKTILVVGGGLTAVQVAQLALRHGSNDRKVILCSRRPLVEKHLDIGLDWVDRRRAQKCQSDFYHRPVQERFQILREARGGGSVPPYYMRQVEQLEAQGRLQRLVGNPNLISLENLLFGEKASSSSPLRGEACQCCRRDSPLVIGIGTKIHRFDGVLVACGIQPDCTQNALFANLIQTMEQQKGDSSKVYQGLPVVSEDLEWFSNIFVVGAMAGLNLGPDAGNLMGARRGASLIANALDCRAWLRTAGNIFANRYSVFDDDDSSTSSEESSDDDDNDSDEHTFRHDPIGKE